MDAYLESVPFDTLGTHSVWHAAVITRCTGAWEPEGVHNHDVLALVNT